VGPRVILEFWRGEKFLPLSETELSLSECPARTLVTMLTELLELLV